MFNYLVSVSLAGFLIAMEKVNKHGAEASNLLYSCLVFRVNRVFMKF